MGRPWLSGDALANHRQVDVEGMTECRRRFRRIPCCPWPDVRAIALPKELLGPPMAIHYQGQEGVSSEIGELELVVNQAVVNQAAD